LKGNGLKGLKIEKTFDIKILEMHRKGKYNLKGKERKGKKRKEKKDYKNVSGRNRTAI
jgi:hypothetical protein